MAYTKLTQSYLPIIEQRLLSGLPKPGLDSCYPLLEAMHYSISAKGKRIRPVLCIESLLLFGPTPLDAILPFAVAVEWIHTYSLIHDDLPALDNDDFRRGSLTTHKKFGESTAILAGDTLHSLAFEHLATELPQFFDPKACLKVIALLAKSCGINGMGGGQYMDIAAERGGLNMDVLKIHCAKTAQIIQACVLGPALLKNASEATLAILTTFGENLGILFQIIDDILDVTQSSNTLGKTANKDIEQEKLTVISAFGLDQAKQLAKDYHSLASANLDQLESLGYAPNSLKILLAYFFERTH